MVNYKCFFVVLLFSLVLSFGLLCSAADNPSKRGEEDPWRQYEECQTQCRVQFGLRGQKCEQQCERQFGKQREETGRRRHDILNPEDPMTRYAECQRECRQEEQSQQPQCQQSCLRQYEQEQRSQGQVQVCQQRCQQEEQRPEMKHQCVRQCREQFEEQPRREGENRREEEEEEEEWEGRRQSHNPYYFPRGRHAQARFQEDNGNFWVLQKFAERHHLLKGINEYRIALIEANPNTFVLPHHCDAEKIYIVTNGKGTLTFLTHKNKESFNLVPGVVVGVPSGSTVYLVNQDSNEKLTIVVLHRPVNNPGKFEEFFPAGQENPQSYYRTFSREILEAVFNTRSEQLDRLFHGKQSQHGMFRRASQEQIRSLSQGATTPTEEQESFAFNLLAQKPKFSNQNGQFFEASPSEFELLRNVDTSILGIEINQGSICAPHYHSQSTFVILVTEGKGYVEMVTPRRSSESSHEEEEEEETRSGEYRKVKARLSPGDIFVVPAGHPVTYVASQNQNLRFLAFGLYHRNSSRIFVGGKDNLVRKMDSAAKELAFGVPSKLVDEIFTDNPKESYFVSGQRQQRAFV